MIAICQKSICHFSFWCLLNLLMFYGFLNAQPPGEVSFDHITADDGLPGRYIFTITQDSMGFIWAGTSYGLARYDGYEVKSYRYDPKDSSLIDGIKRLVATDDNGIWLGSDTRGLMYFNIEDGSFTDYSAGQDSVCKGNYLIYIDKEGSLWSSSEEGGIDKFDPNSKELVKYRQLVKGKPDYDLTNYAYEDAKDNFWIASEGGLLQFDKNKRVFNPIILPDSGSSGGIIIEDKKGNIWISSEGGIAKLKNDEIQLFRHDPKDSLSLSSNLITSAGLASENSIWVGFFGAGLNYFDISKGKFIQYMNDVENSSSLSHNNVHAIFNDREGNQWFGTAAGIDRLKYSHQKFEVYQYEPNNFHSLRSNTIQRIYEDKDGTIWIGTPEGLSRWNRRLGKFTHFSHHFKDTNSLTSNSVTSILKDKDGILWIGTSMGLNRYNPISKEFSRYQNFDDKTNYRDSTQIPHNMVSQLYEDRIGRIWIGTIRGLSLLDSKAPYFKHYIDRPEHSDAASLNVIRFGGEITEDLNGNLWMHTVKGVLRFNPQKSKFTRFQYNPNNLNSISSDYINQTLVDQEGRILVANSAGLDRITIQDDSTFSIERKIVSVAVNSVQEDNNGTLWIGTVDGLLKYSSKTKAIHRYSTEDGLPSNQFGGHSLKSKKTGELFFSTDNGLAIFHPDSLKNNPYIPPIVISSLYYYDGQDQSGQPIEVPNISYQKEISFPYHQNYLIVDIAALSYQKTSKNQYAYMFEGKDKNWKQLGTERRLQFTDMAPGTYNLRVKGSNGDGIWNEEGVRLKIVIHPPWWLTNWAKLVYSFFFLGLLYGIYRWRTLEQRRKLMFQERELKLQKEVIEKEQSLNQQLQHVDKLKDQFLANTSHELRTPLHGMIGLSEALIEKVDNPTYQEELGMIISSGKRLNSLVNDLLDFSKIKHQDLDLKIRPIDLRAVVDVVLQSCYPLIKNKNLQLVNEVPIEDTLVLADENRLQQIFYNLVGNAIKFTETGKVQVQAQVSSSSVKQEGRGDLQSPVNHVVIAVQDSGIGIPENKREAIFQEFEQVDGSIQREFTGTGLGLSISKKLVELQGGKMWVESEVGVGSTFFFTLPMSRQTAEGRRQTVITSEVKMSISQVEKSQVAPIQKHSAVSILLVDDEPINHQVIKNYFRNESYRIQSAMNGYEALDAIQRGEKYDLVLLDIMMPRMSGYQVCEEIRKQYLPSEIPVIMLTAKNQIADLIQGLETGANDYIAKPFSKDEFLARIKTHLNLHRIHSATNKFVPSDFIRTIGRKNITEVRLGDQKEQNITVFFSDIRGYTSLSEQMTPDETFKFVNAYAGRMGPIIQQNNGFVNQYLGDGIMALFQHSPKDAIQAAIDMQHKLHEYNKERLSQGRQPIYVGMGMHTGSLIMGIIGDDQRNDPATISDTVNTAARMEGLTKHFGAQILISETVINSFNSADELKEYHLRNLGLVQVKGKSQPLGVYECLDGLAEDKRELMQQTLADFQSGMQHYFAKDFEQAYQAFEKVLAKNPEDKAAQLYFSRCTSYRMVGVAEDWTGVEKMNEK